MTSHSRGLFSFFKWQFPCEPLVHKPSRYILWLLLPLLGLLCWIDLKKQPLQDVAKRVEEIWQEFLAPGAPSAINLDSHSYEITSQNVKDGGRYTFEDAQVCLSTCKVFTCPLHHLTL